MSPKGPRRRSRLDARTLAIELLVRVEDGAWSDRLLSEGLGALDEPRERRLAQRLVLGTLRWQGALDPRLTPFLRSPLPSLRPPLRAALRLGLYQGLVDEQPHAIAVSTAVDAARAAVGARAGGLVNAVLRRALAADAPPLDAEATLPAWLLERWRSRFGAARTRAFASAFAEPARPFLVARADGEGREALARWLLEDDVETTPSALVPGGLHVQRGVPQASAAWKAAECELLSESAALVGALCAGAPRGPAADLAAAPGGKSLLIDASRPGPLVAVERVASRATRLAATLATRARRPARVVRADGRRAPLAPGRFPLVLLDAPCSGTGILRSRPERRQRLDARDPARAARVQEALLEEAAALVAPGGVLVYAVCSLEAEEGPGMLDRFTAAHPEFRRDDPRLVLGDGVAPFVDDDGVGLLLTPERGGLDGFYAARMTKAR